MILSILEEHPEGLSKYQIFKEIKEGFRGFRRISPGTIYPKLERMRDRGEIIEKNNEYKISSKGKRRLERRNPEVIRNSLQFMPKLYKILMRPIPFSHRMDFLSNMGPFFCGWDSPEQSFEDLVYSEEVLSKSGINKSISKLQALKDRLIIMKGELQERMKVGLETIEKRIHLIDEKIQKFQEKREGWKGVPVRDEDYED